MGQRSRTREGKGREEGTGEEKEEREEDQVGWGREEGKVGEGEGWAGEWSNRMLH